MKLDINNKIIPYKNLESYIFNNNSLLKNLYSNGSFLLWSYDKIPNSFFFENSLWLEEENKRLFEYEYINRLGIKFSDKSSINIIKDKIREDVKNFVFLINYLTSSLKLSKNYDIFFEPSYLNLFNVYKNAVLINKEYNLFFLKQPTNILKKYEILKNLLEKDKNLIFSNKYSYFSNIHYLSINVFSYLFEYFYLFPLPPSVLAMIDSLKKNKLLKIFYFFKDWFISLKEGLRKFYYFVKNKFFFIDLNYLLLNHILNKEIISLITFKRIDEAIYAEQKSYIFSLDPYIDLGILDDDDIEFSLINYLNEDYISIEENYIIEEALNFTSDYFSNLVVNRLNEFFNFSKDFTNSFDLLEKEIKCLHILLLKNIDLLLFFNKIFYKDFFNNKEVGFLNIKGYNNLFNLVKDINIEFENIYNLDTEKKYRVIGKDDLISLKKSISFTPSEIRSFFIEKVISLKEQGSIKKFNSYLFFIEKYFYYTYYLSIKNKKFPNLYNNYLIQKKFSITNEFGGEFFYTWFFYLYETDFIWAKEKYLGSYLNIKKLNSFKFILNVPSPEGKSVYDVSFLNKRGSSGFYKYSSEFLNRIYKEDKDYQDYYVFGEEKTFYNSRGFYFQIFLFLNRLLNILKK